MSSQVDCISGEIEKIELPWSFRLIDLSIADLEGARVVRHDTNGETSYELSSLLFYILHVKIPT